VFVLRCDDSNDSWPRRRSPKYAIGSEPCVRRLIGKIHACNTLSNNVSPRTCLLSINILCGSSVRGGEVHRPRIHESEPYLQESQTLTQSAASYGFLGPPRPRHLVAGASTLSPPSPQRPPQCQRAHPIYRRPARARVRQTGAVNPHGCCRLRTRVEPLSWC